MKLFYEEVQDKKRTARGVHSKTGKKGYVGVMKFPYDLMDSKDKKIYQENGKVVSWNMYEIENKEQFNSLSKEQQREVLTRWRELKKNQDIMDILEIKSSSHFHKLITELGVPAKKKGGYKGRKGKSKATAETKDIHNNISAEPIKTAETLPTTMFSNNPDQYIVTEQKQLQQQKEPSFEWLPQQQQQQAKGMSFKWYKETDMTEIKDMLSKLELLVENDKKKKFSISIEIQENI